jgi:two-component system response regulator YesN
MIRVMIVEDELSSAQHYAFCIRQYGHRFVVSAICRQVSEAREAFCKSTPDVIFCDIKLFRENGLSFLEEIRGQGWKGIAVIMSGYDDFSYAKRAIHLGVLDYLLKPILPQDVERILAEILVRLEQDDNGIENQLLKNQRNNRPAFINRALDYIAIHYVDPISLNDAAEQACVSPTYLSACFKKYTGFTFMEYICSYRIEIAKKLLKDNSLSISQIAQQVGLSDAIYFNKLFKRITGDPPGKFRKQLCYSTEEELYEN